MSDRMIMDLRGRLRGRGKRELIEDMIVHSPHAAATEKAVKALEVFPLLILMLAHDHPTKIWILDRGEKPSSAEILNDEAKDRRWHRRRISIDECEGLTDVVEDYVAVVVSWKTMLIMRHEFAHAATTFMSPTVRKELERIFRNARKRGTFVEPLASESVGEYIACGMSYYFFPDLRDEMREVDPDLYALVEKMMQQAETVSLAITPETPIAPVVDSHLVADRS